MSEYMIAYRYLNSLPDMIRDLPHKQALVVGHTWLCQYMSPHNIYFYFDLELCTNVPLQSQ